MDGKLPLTVLFSEIKISLKKPAFCTYFKKSKVTKEKQ